MEKDICLPLDGELSFIQLITHSKDYLVTKLETWHLYVRSLNLLNREYLSVHATMNSLDLGIDRWRHLAPARRKIR